jgi:hypothetical protein
MESKRRGTGKALPVQLNLDHVAPATRLLEKRRQIQEVQEALDSQKEEYAKREEAFKRREEQLRKKDLELQESLIRFNKFLKVRVQRRDFGFRMRRNHHSLVHLAHLFHPLDDEATGKRNQARESSEKD